MFSINYSPSFQMLVLQDKITHDTHSVIFVMLWDINKDILSMSFYFLLQILVDERNMC